MNIEHKEHKEYKFEKFKDTDTTQVAILAKTDIDAREEICERMHGLIINLANRKKYINENNFDDLIQDGYIGVLRAIEKYDPNRGCKFSTYCYNWILKYLNISKRSEFSVKISEYMIDNSDDDMPQTVPIDNANDFKKSDNEQVLKYLEEQLNIDSLIDTETKLGKMFKYLQENYPYALGIIKRKYWDGVSINEQGGDVRNKWMHVIRQLRIKFGYYDK